MKPAFLSIFYTCVSGLGYGLLLFLSVGVLGKVPTFYSGLGASSPDTLINATGWAVGFGLAGVGLVPGVLNFQLLRRWRSNWVLRSGGLAILSFGLVGLMAFIHLYYGLYVPMLVLICIFVIFLTVFSTSMIYGSVEQIAAWHNRLVPAVFLAFAASSGWLALLVFKAFMDRLTGGDFILALVLVVLAFGLKILWWVGCDDGSGPAIKSRTSDAGAGLQKLDWVISRAQRIWARRIAVFAGVIVSVVALGLGYFFSGYAVLALSAALLAHMVGIVVGRWLFFAQGQHYVALKQH